MRPYCWLNGLFTLFPQWEWCVVMDINIWRRGWGVRNNGNPASFKSSLVSPQPNERHSRDLAFTGGTSRRLRLHHQQQQQQQHQMGRMSGPVWIRRIFPPWFAAALSPLMNPHVCPPTLMLSQRREAVRTIHHRFSSPSPVSFDFKLGNCGGGRTSKCTSAPLGAASSATQRQRTAEQIAARHGDAMRGHLLYFTHVRTHAG